MARLTTLVWLRLTIAWRRLRGRGLADTLVGTALAAIAMAVAIGLAIAVAATATKAATARDGEAILVYHLIVCYLLALMAIVVPVIVGRDGQSQGVRQLVFFPISHRTLYGLNLMSGALSGAHLLWYPALVTFALNGVLQVPGKAAPGLVLVLLLACLLVVWSQTVLLLVEALMRRRSVRELLIIVAFVLFMGVALLPAMVDTGALGLDRRPVLVDVLIEVSRPVVAFLPPSRVARGLTALHTDAAVSLPILVTELLVWIVAGAALGFLVLSRVLLEGPSTAGPRRRRRFVPAAGRRPGVDPWAWLPAGVVAVVGKELRYQLRSTPGKLALLIAPMFVVMIALAVGRLMFAKQELFGIEPSQYAFYGVMLYAGALTANFLVNAFAWEGPGIVAYMINPADARDILLGKNLGVWLFNSLMLCECLLTWSAIRGWPGLVVAVNAALVFAACVLILTMIGNFVSIRFPVRRSIASLGNSSSQVGTVATLAAVVAAGALSGLALVVGLALGGQVAQLCLLCVLDVALAAAAWFLLRPATDLFDARREELVAAMVVVE